MDSIGCVVDVALDVDDEVGEDDHAEDEPRDLADEEGYEAVWD